MGEIVHGINTPVVTGTMMLGVLDPVQGGITHIQVGRFHVDPGPKNMLSFPKLSRTHTPEEIQVFICTPLPKRTFTAGFGQCSAKIANIFSAEAVHVRQAPANQF